LVQEPGHSSTWRVTQYHEAKSVSTENTFDENKTDNRFLMSELVRMGGKDIL